MAADVRTGDTRRGLLSITIGRAESKIHDTVEAGVLDAILRILGERAPGNRAKRGCELRYYGNSGVSRLECDGAAAAAGTPRNGGRARSRRQPLVCPCRWPRCARTH